jgi:L-rhamnose mutarotase
VAKMPDNLNDKEIINYVKNTINKNKKKNKKYEKYSKNNYSKFKKELGEHLFNYLENDIRQENPELSDCEVFHKFIKEWDKYKKTTAKKEKTNNKITEISNDLMKINIV